MSLYGDIVMQRMKNPLHCGKSDYSWNAFAVSENISCGDKLKLYARLLEDGTIEDAWYECEGCALCRASADLFLDKFIGGNTHETDVLDCIDRELAERWRGTAREKCVRLVESAARKIL